MSPPHAIALSGLVFTLAVLVMGEVGHIKGAVTVAFLVGGTMMFGGLAVGLLRSLRKRRRRL